LPLSLNTGQDAGRLGGSFSLAVPIGNQALMCAIHAASQSGGLNEIFLRRKSC
jgi:hypothetical protein